MKRLAYSLDIEPKYGAEFERAGIRSLSDLAKSKNLEQLSLDTGIPLNQVREWYQQARQKIAAARYRAVVAAGTGILIAILLLGLRTAYVRSAGKRSAQAQALFTQGGAAFDKGDYQPALALYDKALQIDPNYQLAYANRGGALRRLGRTQEALASLNKALELNPKDVWAYDERAAAYTDLGQYQRGIEDADKAIQLNPKYQYAYGDKGLALSKLGRYGDALAAFDAALALDPNYRFAYAERGLELSRLGRYQDAVASLDSALKLDPRDPWAYSLRGEIYHDDLFQYEQAYQDLKKASALEPTVVGDQTNLAEAALTSGRFQEAFGLAGKVLAANEKTDLKQFEISDRLSMRFMAIAALLLEGRTVPAKTKLDEFVSYYKSVPPGFTRDWTYSGTRHYIENRPMDRRSKQVLLELIGLIDHKPTSTIAQIERSASGLR
ncbi:MAG TPA: tetratricopeptide repeat protein [Candidatus Acidoferrales bacterium]|nr:tetratricopeptide repeat protein [Candidatus Acidoferrales bacterium]